MLDYYLKLLVVKYLVNYNNAAKQNPVLLLLDIYNLSIQYAYIRTWYGIIFTLQQPLNISVCIKIIVAQHYMTWRLPL